MEVHKLKKPIHHLREFAVEIGTIVIGVLIALLAEQTAESLDWAHRVDIANKAMTNEIADDDGPQIYQRAAIDRCLNMKLDTIEQGLESHIDRQAMVRLIRSYRVEYLSYDVLQREAVNSSGVAVHFSAPQYAAWAKIYADIPVLDRTATQEARDLGRLYALRATGGALSDSEADRVFAAAEDLRSDETVMFQAASWTLPQIFDAGLRLSPARVADSMSWARAHYGACVSNVPMNWQGRALHPVEAN
jgi:hypothetical protein